MRLFAEVFYIIQSVSFRRFVIVREVVIVKRISVIFVEKKTEFVETVHFGQKGCVKRKHNIVTYTA